MANHPLNLSLRFILELCALGAMGFWGWTQHSGPSRWLWTIILPLLAALLWGTLRVPGDPGNAPVAVPGMVRLLLEIAFFGGAVWLLFAAGRSGWAITLLGVTILHYVLSYDRIVWMLKQ